jgi:acetoacetyl-CoA synthetase
MSKAFHTPQQTEIEASQLTRFMRFCEQSTGNTFDSWQSFHNFSVNRFREFWRLFLNWSKVQVSGGLDPICTSDVCEQARFFPNIQLSYVENLLRVDGVHGGELPAVTSWDAKGELVRLSRAQLKMRVARLAAGLLGQGVKPGDRTVAMVNNDADAIVAALAALAVGASVSTAAPDMGAFSITSRFAQLDPQILFCHFVEHHPENPVPVSERIRQVVQGLPTLKKIIVLDDGVVPADLPVGVAHLADLEKNEPLETWPRFGFNHPLFILFSSGTTGKPKCIIHGAGGTLLEHLKEHRLHCNVGVGDKLFFQTSCAWMMWNWQLSALAAGVEIVLNPSPVRAAPDLWNIVAKENVTAFGTSPAYLRMCEESGYVPRKHTSLARLKMLMSTGSVLADNQFDWVRANVGEIPIQSISGGTDIVGCFVLGNPNLPVYRGEAQCKSLAMDVQAARSTRSGSGNEIGELVCRTPFPSRPIGFHSDPAGQRFHEAYFTQNEGVWSHGDLIEIAPRGTTRIHGRIDGVLNVNGIRIGPSEINNLLKNIPGLRETMAVEQPVPDQTNGESRLVLLVVLEAGSVLSGELKRRIRHELATKGSPAHVPELIVEVKSLPVTHSGKTSYSAVRDRISGRFVANAGALRNADCLDDIHKRVTEEDRRRKEGLIASENEIHRPTEEVLTTLWEKILDLRPVNPNDNFFELGGTSLKAIEMLRAVHAETGKELPPSTLFEAPTVAQLAAIVESQSLTHSVIVEFSSSKSGTPVYLVPGLAGDTLELRALAESLCRTRPVRCVRARGLDGNETPHTDVEAMASYYREHIQKDQPNGPYAIVGYSFGGLVAFEMARQLRFAGEEVSFLGLLDTVLHENCLTAWEKLAFRFLRKLQRISYQSSQRMPASQSLLKPLIGMVEKRLKATQSEPVQEPWTSDAMTPQMVEIESLSISAFRAYRPQYVSLPLTFFKASMRGPNYCDPVPLWNQYSGGCLRVIDVSGDHFSMIREPLVEMLARKIERELVA